MSDNRNCEIDEEIASKQIKTKHDVADHCCKIWCYVSNYCKATLPQALDIALVFLWLTLNRLLSNEHHSAIDFLGKLDRTCQILYFLYDYSSESEMNMNIFPKDWNKEIFSHQSFSCMNKIPQRRSIMP